MSSMTAPGAGDNLPEPAPRMRPQAPQQPTTIGRLMRGPFVFGTVVVLLFFGAFGGWAATAPLDSGAIAPGVVSPETNRWIIQHLEGGIVRQLYVHEGQLVAKGDLLMTLESTRAQATFSSGREQWLRLLVVRARLDALQNGNETMVIPDEAVTQSTPAIAEFIKVQQRLFEIRRTSLEQQKSIFGRQIEQLNSEIAAIEAENAGLGTQIDLIERQILVKQKLFDQQLVAESALLELQSEQARMRSSIAANMARVAQARQSIEETNIKVQQAVQSFGDQIAQESTQTNNQIAQIDEDMISAGDVLRRTELRSPVDGTVLNIRSQSGVIAAGQPIMEVVPVNDDLIILARLPPKDLDVVQVGLKSHVSLLPFAGRNALPLNGEVTQVAADITVDDRTGQSYYQIRIRVTAEELAKHQGFYLAPGMPADVTVVTGERTMLQYLADPLVRSIRYAFVHD